MAWAVEGCLDWQRDGLAEPEVVKLATSEYRGEQDIIAGFLDECCRVEPNQRERASTLLRCYQDWCQKSGEKAINRTRFGKALSERGFQREKAGVYWYIGVALESELDD